MMHSHSDNKALITHITSPPMKTGHSSRAPIRSQIHQKNRFSREAAVARHLWVKRVAGAMNSQFMEDDLPAPTQILVCGSGGLKSLLCGHNDVHFKQRPLMWSCPEKIDPAGKIDRELRKVHAQGGQVGADRVDGSEAADWSIGCLLAWPFCE